MSNNSIIEHRANYYFIELREEYLHICQECSYKKNKSKASSHCKAFILAIMESWTNDKRGKGEDLAIYMTYPQWIEAMYGMFGRCVIIDSLEELIGEGLLSREKHRMYGKDTYKYRLNCQELNRRVKLLPERDPKQTRPKIDASTNRRDNSEHPSISRRDTRLKVDEHPSKSRHNIESTKKPNIESKESTSGNNSTKIEPDSLTPSSTHSLSSSSTSVSNGETSESVEHLSTSVVDKRASSVDNSPEPQLPIATVTTGNTSSTVNVRNTEPLQPPSLSLEEQRIDGYWQEIGFISKPAAKEHWKTLSKHIHTLEEMRSLYQYTQTAIKDKPNRRVYPGNLVDHLDGWKQAQAPLPVKPAKRKLTDAERNALPV